MLPSVTQVMQPLSQQIYGSINETVLAAAQNRGTAVHEAIEMLEKTGWKTEDEEIQGYLDAYLKFRSDLEYCNPIATESMLYHPMWLYAGRIDSLFQKPDGGYVLCDIKTTASQNYALHGVQLAAYAEMLKNIGVGIEGAIIVYLAKDGEYQTSAYLPAELHKYFIYFVSCLKINSFKAEL